MLAHVHEYPFSIFNQDFLISSIIFFIVDLVDVETLLKLLDVCSYQTISVLLDHEEKKKPVLTPISLDQIDESNVYDCVNILSNYPILPSLDVIRYANHISQFDTICSIHLIQNFILEIPPSCLFYFPLKYFDSLQRAVKHRLTGRCYTMDMRNFLGIPHPIKTI